LLLPIQRFKSDPFISDSNVVVPKSDDNSKLPMLNVDPSSLNSTVAIGDRHHH
jgi:hypothetical protein